MITRYHPVMSVGCTRDDLDSVTITMAQNSNGAYVRYDEYKVTLDALIAELKSLDDELISIKEKHNAT